MNTPPIKTKSQRRQANERTVKAAIKQFEIQMGPMPDAIREFGDEVESNLYIPTSGELEPIEKAPAYMRDASDPSGNYAWNNDAILSMVNQASLDRSREREIRIKELREKYPEHWGKRGGAKVIARTELELDPESAPSERIVQEYFVKTRTRPDT